MKIELVEKYKNMNPVFEQKHYSRPAEGSYRIGHECIRLMEWMAYFNRCSENMNYFYLMASVFSVFIEISQ